MQSQIICSGCRNIIYYPRGAANVRCAVCSTVSTVAQAQPMVADMDQLICGGCRTLLMYARGATTVRCLCCHTMNFTSVNVPSAPNQFSTVSCGNCRTVLMYTYGAPSVKCAICHFVTNVDTGSGRFPSTADRPNGTPSVCSTSANSQTVVVENPTSVDESGKLVTNVVVGVTTEKK